MVRPFLHLRATGLCLSKQIGEGLLRPENPTLSRDNARLFFGVRLALLVLQFLVFCLSWSRNERIMASTRSCNWSLPMPEGPIKCPIWPQNSWYLLSEYINSTLATCASKCGNCHRKKRFMHLFDTCKRTNFTISVTFAGFGIVGEMLLKYCKSLLYKELS